MAPVCSAVADAPPAAPGGDPRATPASSRPPPVSDRDPTAAPPAVVVDHPSDCPCPGRIRIPDGRHGVEEPIRDNPPPANPGGRAGIGEPIIDNKPPPHRNPGGRAGIDEPIIDNPRKGSGRPEQVPVEPVPDNPRSTHGNQNKAPLALQGTDEKKTENHPPPPAAQAEASPVIPHPSPTHGPITEPIKDNPASVFSHLSLTHGPGGPLPAPTEPIKDNP